ncbi:hypothetical protein QTP70_008338 [Hemibagrus guttatus]|uniref:Reverse transcriptase domain-containing protein n=1 Tax=Hemibagrus guttatus TaxID=175788 RepID=A0AAE0VFU1_9TELE|nr:hypothetical protein QTP70_008338 [Hemibagrus guttatus]KAK3574742.1 hypothetical protein QTP86_017529 [Hemibagrus guttatus]
MPQQKTPAFNKVSWKPCRLPRRAFNIIISQHLTEKLSLLGINTSFCNWILDFLTGRPQSVWIGNSISSTTTLNTGAPQSCMLNPLLFTLLTHDCTAMHSSNHIKLADDMTVVDLISKNDESAYREDVQRLTAWCKANNLSLNVKKMKEMVVDFRRVQSDHSPLNINESNMEIKSTKFLGVHLADDLTWSLNTSSITKKAQQCLYFLRRLRKAHLPPPMLTTFYRGTIKSIFSNRITAWFRNCTISDRKILQWIVRTADKIIGVSLPSITDIYTTHCIRKANNIVDDHTPLTHTLHPPAIWKEVPKHSDPHNQTVEQLLPSGSQTLLPALPEGSRGVPRSAESLSSMSWVFPGVSSRWGMPGTPPQETSRRHPKQMPEPPQLSPFDVEEQWLYSDL